MATITIKKTKLGKRFVLLEKQYELIPELWEEVMSYFSEAIEKYLIKLSVPNLHKVFKSVFNMRMTNVSNTLIAIEKRRAALMKPIMKYHHRKHSIVKYLPKKPEPKKPEPKDWSGHHVGMMVRWPASKYSDVYVYGRIIHIGEASVLAQVHKYNVVYANDNHYTNGIVHIGEKADGTKRFLSPLSRYLRSEDGELFRHIRRSFCD